MIEERSLRLFKSIVVKDKKFNESNKDISKKTIKYGFVFTKDLEDNYPGNLESLIPLVKALYGKDSLELNQALHKSFSTVRDSDIEDLIIQQVMHYITVYGFDSLGIYDDKFVYIPKEELDIPELEDSIKLMVIRSMSIDELKDSIVKLITSGIALSEQTMGDIMILIENYDIDIEDIDSVKNNEIKVALYDFYGRVPENNVDFLRYIIYKITGQTLLIKNEELVGSIKQSLNSNMPMRTELVNIFRKYNAEYGIEKLAEVFFRFKPIWLSFKCNDNMNHFINKIRKLADKYHKPLKQDILSNITSANVDEEILEKKLSEVSTFRKIRALNSLGYRIMGNKEFLYRIRNGKAYVEVNENINNINNIELYSKNYNIIYQSIVNDIKPKVEGKRIFIPKNVVYSLPSSEKQFVGNIPNFSFISTGDKIVAGVHWFNKGESYVDLDLKLQNVDSIFGWDQNYRSNSEEVYFTGDITSAPRPNGALEAYYVGERSDSSYLFVVNNFTYGRCGKDNNVKFDIIIDNPKGDRVDKNYIINHNTVEAKINSEMNESKKVIGLIKDFEGEKRFYFTDFSIGKGITSRQTEEMNNAYKYLDNYTKSAEKLEPMLRMAGAIIVDDKEDCDIDLSIESITKESIIELLTKDE